MAVTTRQFLGPLTAFGYPGKIYPVNPTAGEIEGLKAYPTLKSIPGPVDYVICSVPREKVAQVVLEAAEVQARVMTVFTSGFGESGTEEGCREEKRIAELARRSGVRLIGPNCLGLHCPEAGISLEPGITRQAGEISYLCQSGGNAQDFILAAAERRVFFRRLVSFGNACDLNESDFLEHFADDSGTETITAYIEGVKQPSRFQAVLRRAAARKPVIMLKGGKGKAGSEAVVSHTGSLAGSRLTWDCLCRQAGVVQVRTIEDLIDTAMLFHYWKGPCGKRAGIINMGGGSSVLAADECEDAGIEVPRFPAEIGDDIRRFLPGVGMGFRNPIDSSSDFFFNTEMLDKGIQIVARWSGTDVVLVCVPAVGGAKTSGEFYRQVVADTARSCTVTGKPTAVILRTGGFGLSEKLVYESQDECYKLGLPVFKSFTSAALAINRYASYYERAAKD